MRSDVNTLLNGFKQKHRIIRFLTTLLLIFILTQSALAADTVSYQLEPLDMTISFPSDYVVFTRDLDETDPNLAKYGLTKDYMSELMTSGDIYLNGWDSAFNNAIIITMTDNDFKDFNLLSDKELSDFAPAFIPEYKRIGITYLRAEVYQHKQEKFLKIYFSQPEKDSTTYGLQYYTVYANKAINIIFRSYTGTINTAQESILSSIIDSTIFGTEPEVASTASPNPLGSPDFSAGNIIISLIITIIVYSLPIIIYRYGIRKSPVERRNAKIITIIYGIVAFLIMAVIIFSLKETRMCGGAIVFWSFINYQILIGGTNKSPDSSSKTDSNDMKITPLKDEAADGEVIDIEQKPQSLYCHICGNKLRSDGRFCDKCGTQVPIIQNK